MMKKYSPPLLWASDPIVNTLALHVEVVASEDVREIDGIQFSSCAFVQMEIDGENLLNREDFRGSFIYFAELEKSVLVSGRFLIFTCACGIADDAGWREVEVVHSPGTVSWTLQREGQFRFLFALPEYEAQIESCRAALGQVPNGITIEPQYVVFPE